MNNPVFIGSFKTEMQDFLTVKRALGYKYIKESVILKRFDAFLAAHYPSITSLTKEAVTSWCAKTTYEATSNQGTRASVIRQFAKYLDSIGIDAFILPHNYYPYAKKYVPYIYTEEELCRFFAETDKNRYCSLHPYRHLIMPIFFRLLLACGLRCSEARLLKVQDVDLENGVLSILNAKNKNDRLVPMPKSITIRMKQYAQQVHTYSEPERYFFPALNDAPMTLGNVYKNFRRFLWRAGISHTGDGPRVHDFRHTYCIYRLRAWVEEERDLMVLIPMMCTYLGHQTFTETAYYLRMTADVFPNIRLKLERNYANIIPNMEDFPYETN